MLYVITFVFATALHQAPMQMSTLNTWPSAEACEQDLEKEATRFTAFLLAQKHQITQLSAQCVEDPRAQGYPPGNIDKGGI